MQAPRYHILVLGGYGTFGRRICECLASEASLSLTIAGRHKDKADELCQQLHHDYPAAKAQSLELDINHPNLEQQLANSTAQLVIHTCGPFQSQDYRVAEACIATGKHYIDLADDRQFVCDFEQLNPQAHEAGVLLVAGASSVPGLSAAIIDHFSGEFSDLESVDYAISPGNKLERGYATVKSILSYTGHVFTTWEGNQWREVHGWMDSQTRDFGSPIGKRWLANINIPDLALFPNRYPSLKRVRFQAGLELAVMHHAMGGMAWLTKKHLVKSWAPFTQHCLGLSRLFYRLGTDNGGMQMKLAGKDQHQKPLTVEWTLIAENGVGPFIPTIASILIAKKLANGALKNIGAQACMDLFSLTEFMDYANQWGIYTRTERTS